MDFGKQVGEQREPHSEIPPAVQWREHVELSMGIWAKGCVLFFWKGTHGCIWSVGPSGKANVTTGGHWCLMVHRTSVQRVAAVKENSETGDDRTEKKTHKNNCKKKNKRSRQTWVEWHSIICTILKKIILIKKILLWLSTPHSGFRLTEKCLESENNRWLEEKLFP